MSIYTRSRGAGHSHRGYDASESLALLLARTRGAQKTNKCNQTKCNQTKDFQRRLLWAVADAEARMPASRRMQAERRSAQIRDRL